jgi:hypothetical protein
MKNIPAFRSSFLALSAAMAWTLPLHAADPIETHWADVCNVATGQQLVLTTADGATVEGYCIRINAEEMGIRTLDSKTVTIARAAPSRLQLRRKKGGQLASLGHGLRTGLRDETGWLLSPMAPLGLVAVPATLAWGAMSAPFCALGDLVAKLTPPQREIKLIADSAPATRRLTGNNL